MDGLILISRADLQSWLQVKVRECVMLNAYSEMATFNEINNYVKHMPAVDTAPVVRCKDCWKNNTEDCPRVWSEGDPLTGDDCISKFYEPEDEDNWFCANGERRDDGLE